MTEREDPLKQIERAAAELIPKLTERLGQHGLGEIEVRHGDLRIRVARALAQPQAPAPGRAAPAHGTVPAVGVGVLPSGPSTQGVTSPAVGFFIYADGLGPGLPVDKGDE